MHTGQETRVRYEVLLYHITNRGEDLKDWVEATNYKDAIKKAKEYSCKEGISSARAEKNIDYYYPESPEDIQDTIVEKSWIYKNGKLVGTYNF